MAAEFYLGLAAYVVAWFWGGRPERFAAAVMLVQCVFGTILFALRSDIDGNLLSSIGEYVLLLIFGWLSFRSNRWWPFILTAALGLTAAVDFVGLLDPALSHRDEISAKVGLGYLIDLTLLLSVFERMLAGEPPAGRAAWVRANLATIARRSRTKSSRHSKAGLVPHGKSEPTAHRTGTTRLPA